MPWFLAVIFLISAFNNLSEAKFGKRLPSVVVVGTVYCDTCFRTDFSKTSHFISAALVAVECRVSNSKPPSFMKEVRTNDRGEFKVRLPFSVSKHVKTIKGCSVKLISSSEPFCSVASTATSDSLHLKSRKKGVHIFSAGFFTFKPLNQPTLCGQTPTLLKSKKSIIDPLFPFLPTNQNNLPPLPALPNLPTLPQLPPLPPLPGFPNLPKEETKMPEKLKSTEPFKTLEVPLFPSPQPGFGFRLPPNPFQPPYFFPQNPFLPPPLTLPPPNPLQRPPPRLIFPGNPFQPSPPVSPVPPLVGLTPPPSPPLAPVGLPPFPFQPAPGFPGIPPVAKKTSP